MSRTSRNLILLLTVVLGLGGRALASSTAAIAVNGAAQPGDTSAITIMFNGFVETVRIGQFSTPASIASAFGAMFSRDYLQSGLCANASGNVINFKLKGTATFGTVDIVDPTNSFQFVPSGFYSDALQVADSGTVTLTVNGILAATTNYQGGATPGSIAAGLAAGVENGSPVRVVAFGDSVYLESTATGSATNYQYSLQNAGWDSRDFSLPSFPDSTVSGNLEGGADASSGETPQPIYSFAGSYDGVGNLSSYNDFVMGAWNFSYDTLNRLASSQNMAASTWSSQYAGNYGCWSYDSFGNRLSQSMSTTPCGGNPPLMHWAQYNGTVSGGPVNGAGNNQMSATDQNGNQVAGYDAAGNVINDGSHTYRYDGEGRLCAVQNLLAGTMIGYLYDADGTRIAKGSIQTMSCDPAANGFQTTEDYVLGPSGEQMTEMVPGPNNSMKWQRSYVYAASKLLATYDSSGLHFYLNDPLGTRRVQTDYTGAVEQRCSSLPYGDSDSCTYGHLFTGKERDSESGNDYFGARYYASSMGRWLSPDWSAKADPIPYARLGYPQSLNLYAYVENNPLSRADIDGHYWCNKAPGSLACQNENAWDSQHGILTDGSKNAIANSALTGQQQKDFTTAVEKSAGRANIDPNILVGMAQQESSLGANMNANGAAKGLYGIENGQMTQMNKMFKLDITTSDLLSLSAGSMMKVSTGTADYLGHYADVFSSRTDPRGIDIAIGVWRVGIGNARKALQNGNFWDYVAPNDRFKETLSHYVDAVEKYEH